MSQDIDQAIEQYMKHEALKGHFEHSLNEVKAGVDGFVGQSIEMGLGRLQERGTIGVREKGARFKRVLTYYYLKAIERMCKNAWGNEFGKVNR
jgi:hypothetical protein